jgi:hypothetical protein
MRCLGKWNEIHFILLSGYFIFFPVLFHNLLFHFLLSLFYFISSLELYHNYFIVLLGLFHCFARLVCVD